LLVFLPGAAFGQVTVDTSEIAGLVLDATGARIGGATITLADPARGRERTLQTGPGSASASADLPRR
jgi:hypothetical protein